ncbi:hypothetical protein V8C40DRAFT_149834 [Trichoderma camerunense]
MPQSFPSQTAALSSAFPPATSAPAPAHPPPPLSRERPGSPGSFAPACVSKAATQLSSPVAGRYKLSAPTARQCHPDPDTSTKRSDPGSELEDRHGALVGQRRWRCKAKDRMKGGVKVGRLSDYGCGVKCCFVVSLRCVAMAAFFGENRKDYQPWTELAADNRYLGIINSKRGLT